MIRLRGCAKWSWHLYMFDFLLAWQGAYEKIILFVIVWLCCRIYLPLIPYKTPKRAHSVEKKTSIQRWFNVLTLNQRLIDVVSTLCACWEITSFRNKKKASFRRFVKNIIEAVQIIAMITDYSRPIKPRGRSHKPRQNTSHRQKKNKPSSPSSPASWSSAGQDPQHARNVEITSNQRRCNVTTLHRRWCDVV